MSTSVQERLKLKRITLDTWSTREKLALASAVQRSGENWSCVSRNIRGFADPNRPVDWFSQKNCAQQYASLLENVETPKRKKRSGGFAERNEVDTPGESIVKNLTSERMDELKKVMAETQTEYLKLLDEINAIALGEVDDKIPFFLQELEAEKIRKEQEKEAHIRWLKEREERKLELQRAWKPGAHLAHVRRTSSLSEPSSDADSPLNEPLNVDVPEETLAPKPTPTSPLLTSLLKSPASVPSSSSILHSAITSPMRGVSPTIANLLSSSPANLTSPLGVPPANQSSNLKNLVSNALGSYQMEDTKPPQPYTPTPSQGAPTLSMLLELPPSMPGKPLPLLQPPAPPPYSDKMEHLGPPPPYSLATEYLQKQKAEQAANAQLIASPQKVQPIETPTQLTQPTLALPPSVTIDENKPDLDECKPEPISTPERTAELIEPTVISPRKESPVLAHNTSDHDYVDVQLKAEEEDAQVIPPDKTTEVETVADTLPEEISSVEVIQTEMKESAKPEKKTELDVFDFDEQQEVCEDAKLSYLKSNAQRLAKKEADRAETLRKSTETRIPDEDQEKQMEESISAEKDEELPVEEKVVEVEHITEVESTTTTEVEEVKEDAVVEVKQEPEDKADVIVEVPVESGAEEDTDTKIEQEIPKPEDTLPQSSLHDLSTTEDEKSNDAPARLLGKRRTTLSLSASDSVPNSPTPVTEEEKEYKAWKKSVLLMLTRIMSHRSASLFLKPISDDQAPGYSTSVLRAMDLTTLKRNIESGVIRTTDEVQRDIMLMFFNAAMFNKQGSVVYQMSADMNKDVMEHIQMLLQATGGNQPSRRETRTQDRSEGKARTLRLSTKMDSKRKRASTSTGSEQARKKTKVEDS